MYKIGEIFYADSDIEINKGLETCTLTVTNLGDRPIQVGSHFHFFEANKYLEFDREKAFGFRLDIPSGTAIRFEPGEEKDVNLVKYSGNAFICGFNGLTNGRAEDESVKKQAIENACALGFKGA